MNQVYEVLLMNITAKQCDLASENCQYAAEWPCRQ